MPYNILYQQNPYFRNLSPEGQKKFVDRVAKFLNSKYFIGRKDVVVTDEMKVLISGSAVQLTFGLSDYDISHLHTINIFPRAFYSKMFQVSFKGLTTQGGVLSLSWDDFNAGYSDYSDKLNLGLHELAHALNIDLDESGNYDRRFSAHFESWRRVSIKYFLLLKQGEINFLRSYGGRNMHEFFAVCIEHFFETPAEFQKALPELYTHMVLLMNQDPLNTGADYKVLHLNQVPDYSSGSSFSERIAVKGIAFRSEFRKRTEKIRLVFSAQMDYTTRKEVVKKQIGKNGLFLTMLLTVLGLFAGIPLLFWFAHAMIVPAGTILTMVFFLGFIGLLKWKYVKDLIDIRYYQFTMYSFVGFAVCMLNMLLFLNMNIAVSGHTETYDVTYFKKGGSKISVSLRGADNMILERVTDFMNEHLPEASSAKKITVTFDTGILGFDMVSGYKLY